MPIHPVKRCIKMDDIHATRVDWEYGCAFCKHINRQRIIYMQAQNDADPNRMYLYDMEMMDMACIIGTAVIDRNTSIQFNNL